MGLETAVLEHSAAMPALVMAQVENMPASEVAFVPEAMPVVEKSTLQETPVDLDFKAAAAKIQQEGGIDAHRNRYGDKIGGCPFRDIIGTVAGRQLIESMAKPDRPPTMAERLAARRAEQAAVVRKPQPTTETAPRRSETHLKILPEMPSVSEKEATQQQYDVKNTTTFEAPAVAVFIAETPPVLPAMEPLVRSLPFAPAKQVEQFVTPPVSLPEMPAAAEITEAVPTAFRPISRIVEAIQEPVRTTAVHNNPVTPDTRETAPAIVVLPATKQRAAIVQPVETPFRPADIIPSADNAPLPVEVPFLAESPLPVSRELPVTASVPSLFEAALAPVVAVETAELPETEASAVSYATQATAFEAAIDEWLRAEAPQVGLAESPRPAEPVAQEQPVAGAITTTETAVVPETITPPIQLETALKVNVLAMLEAITQAVTEIRQSPEVAAGEPSTEIVEALCVELFAMLGSRPDDETIRAIVRDILSWLPALADGRVDGLFALPTEGTHEYKMTLAASLFTHFTQAIQRRARQIASASRYMVAHISEPLTYRFVDIPTT